MIAEKHLKSIGKIRRMEVKWLADIAPARLQKLGEEYGVSEVTTDYRDILADKEVGAVIICTPPNLHKEMFVESLRAGKHVFLEKPAAMNLQEIDEMIEFQKQYPGAIVCDCSARHSRLQPKYNLVKKIISSGALGDIYYIHHNSVWRNGRPGIEYHPEAKWFLNKSIAGGGPLFDWGVYDLSFHLGILDDEYELEAISDVMLKSGLDTFDPGNLIYDVEEMFTVQMKLSNGIRFSWERGNHANMEVPNETRIYGTRAGLKFGYCSWDAPVVHVYDYDKDGKARHTEIAVDGDDYSDDEALIVHFCDLLDGKAKPAMPLELARKHLDIIWKCYQSIREGATFA
jgi:predicted dehydrogenase